MPLVPYLALQKVFDDGFDTRADAWVLRHGDVTQEIVEGNFTCTSASTSSTGTSASASGSGGVQQAAFGSEVSARLRCAVPLPSYPAASRRCRAIVGRVTLH